QAIITISFLELYDLILVVLQILGAINSY
ncbi:uncharacterized protein METZ01_LOCUS473311, partial [marine metagenome]